MHDCAWYRRPFLYPSLDAITYLMLSPVSLEQTVLARLADRGYGILQLGRLVPERFRRLLTDDADSSVFRILINDPVIFILQVFDHFGNTHTFFANLPSKT
jgi:hypothetical protein